MYKPNILISFGGALAGLTTSYLVYRIARIYLKRRKYRHIPGPPTKGFEYSILLLTSFF
jgi:hypothetical protein